MKGKSTIVSTTTSSYNNTLPSFHAIFRPSRPSVLDVNNLLCSAEEKSTTIMTDIKSFDASSTTLKVKRKRATPAQLSVLNRVFNQTFFPPTELRIKLGKQLGMSPRTVQIWFQNKRQSMRNGSKQLIPRHRQRKKIDNNNNNSINATPLIFSSPLSPLSALSCNQSMITSSPYHKHHQYQQQQLDQMLPPPSSQQQQQPLYYNSSMVTVTDNTKAIMSSSPIPLLSSPSLIMKPIALVPLRLPSPTSACCITSSATSPSSTTSLPTPTSIDLTIYRD